MEQNKTRENIFSSNDHKADAEMSVFLFLNTCYYLMTSITYNDTKFWTTKPNAVFSFSNSTIATSS